MANSPQKRKADAAFEEPSNTVSRSGRVRKPKLFEDCVCPSDMIISKRRSLPTAKTAKVKKPLPNGDLVNSSPPLSVSIETAEQKTPEKLATFAVPVAAKAKAKPKPAAIGNNRRRTVCVPSGPVFEDTGNGCIVCDRSDVKKGRFVNCIDCIKRGHFTCLRTEKLFKTADQESNWQCPSCKICEFCNKSKPNVSIASFFHFEFNRVDDFLMILFLKFN